MTAAPIIVISAYIAAQMMADISSLRIIMIAGLSMDAGTLIYPLTFTLRDMIPQPQRRLRRGQAVLRLARQRSVESRCS